MNEETKALLIAIAFLAFFIIVPLDWHGQGADYFFHLSKAEGIYSEGSQGSYPPLFHWLAGLFTAREEFFKLFTLFLFAAVTPLLLFAITRRAVAVWFYFSTTSYFYYIDAGMYPQGLAMILLLGLFATKNNLIRLGIVMLSIIAHSTSVYLVTFAFLVILAKENELFSKLKGLFARGFCSPFWGKEMPDAVKPQVGSPEAYPVTAVTVNSILSFFTKVCPLPFLYWSIKGHLTRKRWDFLIIMLVAFVAAFFTTQRVFYTVPLMMIPGLVWHYENHKYRKWILLLSGIWFIFLLEQWWAIATQFFC